MKLKFVYALLLAAALPFAASAQATYDPYTGSVACQPEASATGIDSQACGRGANASGVNSNAEGVSANASGDFSNARGSDSRASGRASTADGTAAYADGDYSTANGAGAGASGFASTATGNNARSSGYLSTSTGAASQATQFGSTANGAGSEATAVLSTADGYQAKARGYNCVASGAGSVCNDTNEYSVGNATTKRRITNVDNGRIEQYSTDAVNGGQIFAIQQDWNDRWDNINNRVTNIEGRLGGLDKRISGVCAIGQATGQAALSTASINKKNRLGMGAGSCGGQVAVSFGYQRDLTTPGGSPSAFSFGMSTTGDDTSVGVGWAIGW